MTCTTALIPRTRTSRRQTQPPPRRTLGATGPSAAAVDAALEGATLDDTFTLREQAISVRWMWQHLLEEYTRHNGTPTCSARPSTARPGM